jgi:hypothetical protein
LEHEGDQGLWEIVWSLNHTHPGASVESKVALAREVVFALVDQNRVIMRTAPWPAPPATGTALSVTELERLREEDEPWCDPSSVSDLVVWLTAT